jgi:biotin carboxyl carrier protein
MSAAKPVSLSVRPYKVSHLCFEVDGILELTTPLAELGTMVPAFDFPAFYAILGGVPTVPGHPSQLIYNFPEIDAAVAPFALAALRSEQRKASLNKAINNRQNAYYAKYANVPAIISRIDSSYSPSIVGSKMQRLEVLSALSEDQWTELKGAYTIDGRTGVVRTTNSLLTSSTRSSGDSTTNARTDELSISNPVGPGTFAAPPADASWTGVTATGSGPEESDLQLGSNQGTSSSSGQAFETQQIANTDYSYRTPYYEAAAQYERAQISLIDQQFAQFMATQNLPYLAQVFKNELQNIDSDVFRLQIAYLNSVLMSPIAGTVTGVYKHPGDSVRAGEPVLRIEDNGTIFLMATVVYRGPIAIGSTVTVQTKLFGASPLPAPLTGSVVSVRGHRDDDTWDLIVKCNNLDAASKPIFPLGYHFDYDDTTVTIA